MKIYNRGALCSPSVLFAFVFLFSFQMVKINAANILVVISFGSKSHKIAFEPLFEELASRGHRITLISLHKASKNNPNITEIEAIDYDELIRNYPNPFDLRVDGASVNVFGLTEVFQKLCHAYLGNPKVQGILNEKFDLIFTNVFMGECSYGLLSHFKTKTIFLSSMPMSWISIKFGVPTLPSINSYMFYGYSERMTFLQRIRNFYGHIYCYYSRNYLHVPKLEQVYREYFPDAESVFEIEREANLMLINSHPSMGPAMALLPDMIEIGGIHCRNAKPLPKDLKDFLDGSGEDGFIYFSMGTWLQGTSMPERYRKAFVQAFSKLKQRVLWKYESDEMPDKPHNVMINKWLPQQDVLGHPNIKLFITHGGLLSGQEAVYHGVPLLGIPLFADQDGNMQQAQNNGYALTMELTDITEELILEKISLMLNDKTFSERVNSVSVAFRDRPESPLKTAVFWTEYLLRQKDGARHLRSVGRDLNVIVFNSLDVIFTIFLILLTGLYFLYQLIRLILRTSSLKICMLSRKASCKNETLKQE